jgi:DNA-binding transcriptional MerR regulator
LRAAGRKPSRVKKIGVRIWQQCDRGRAPRLRVRPILNCRSAQSFVVAPAFRAESTRRGSRCKPARVAYMTSKPALPIRSRRNRAGNNASDENSRLLKIGEAARVLGVEAYVLRFWETQFPGLRPNHSQSKHRLYDQRDIKSLRLIKQLLYEEGFTIEGARKRLKELSGEQEPAAPASPAAPPVAGAPARRVLLDIRRDLESLYRLLKD